MSDHQSIYSHNQLKNEGPLQYGEREKESTRLKAISKAVTSSKEEKFTRTSEQGSLLIKKIIVPFAEEIQREVSTISPGPNAADIEALRSLDVYVMAGITLSVMLDNLAKGQEKRSTVCRRIGQHLLQEVNMGFYEERNKGFLDWMFRTYPRSHRRRRMIEEAVERGTFGKDAEESRVKWSEAIILKAGFRLIRILVDMDMLRERTRKTGKRRATTYLEWSEQVKAWCSDVFEEIEFLRPIWVPLLTQPEPFVEGVNRSYGKEFPIIPLKKENRKSRIGTEVSDSATASVNSLCAQAWRINSTILEVAKYCRENGVEVGDLVSAEPAQIPPYPDTADQDAIVRWKREAHRIYIYNAKRFGKRLGFARSLHLCQEYRGKDFYFLYQLDSRGRSYPLTSSLLNPQGSDLSKGLLTFSEGESIGEDGLYWLGIHAANKFGVGKVSFDERAQWVEENRDHIKRTGEYPISCVEFWSAASDPWQFLAACIELANAWEQGIEYVSSLPIAFDGTCSGIQHYSLLLRDEAGCKSVNLSPATASTTPSDVYTDVLDTLVSQLVVDSTAQPVAEDWLDLWEKGYLDRKLSKSPTMTYVYGARSYTFREHVDAWLAELNKEHSDLPEWVSDDRFSHTLYIAGTINPAIRATVPRAVAAMDWLVECAGVITKAGYTDITWYSPCGIEVSQRLVKIKKKKIQTRMFGVMHSIYLGQEKPKEPNKRKHKNALTPNFVHSLDASHLLLTIKNFAGPLSCVHDSYATIPAHAARLRECLLETLQEMYTDLSLEDYRIFWQERYMVELPTPPSVGAFDLSLLPQCVYAFE